MTENTLRQADNRVTIEGVLLEKRLDFNTINGKEAITGELDIETAENEVHTVRVFSYKLKQDGSENGIFKGLNTVKEEYKSVADVGREQADKVRVNGGQIGFNEYYGQDGQLRSFPQLSTNFVNRVQTGDVFSPKAEFEVEIVVKVISDEIKNEEETGRSKVTGFIPLYGGRVIPFDFVVTKEGSDYVQSNYEPGQTVKVYGDIVNFKETKEILVEVAFGKPQKKTTSNTIREYLITGGSEPYDEEEGKSYDIETIKKALTEREIYLEELKNKKSEPLKSEPTKSGFDTKPKKNVLPF